MSPHPGVYIKEELKTRGWLQRDLAFILGCREQVLNPILSGKRGVSAKMAKAFGKAFDVSPELFLNLQHAYQLSLAQEPNPGVAMRARISVYPVREMIRRGWIEDSDDPVTLGAKLAEFFEVDSVDDLPHIGAAEPVGVWK